MIEHLRPIHGVELSTSHCVFPVIPYPENSGKFFKELTFTREQRRHNFATSLLNDDSELITYCLLVVLAASSGKNSCDVSEFDYSGVDPDRKLVRSWMKSSTCSLISGTLTRTHFTFSMSHFISPLAFA